MVGTNWGARKYERARRIAWTGAATVAVVCGSIGLIVAFQPSVWLNLFSDDHAVAQLGALYLRIVGPFYLCFGLGLGLFFVSQGFGRGLAAMSANAARLIASAAGGLLAIYLLERGIIGFFVAVSAGFCLYAGLLVYMVLRIKMPDAAAGSVRA
jgi:Na+-driven multidrug efflux pump